MIEIIVTYEIYHSEYNNTTRARYYHIMSVKYHLKSKMANNKKQLSAAESYWAEYICLILFQCMLTTFGPALKIFLRSEINDPQTNLKFELNFMSINHSSYFVGLPRSILRKAIKGRNSVAHSIFDQVPDKWGIYTQSWIKICLYMKNQRAANDIKRVQKHILKYFSDQLEEGENLHRLNIIDENEYGVLIQQVVNGLEVHTAQEREAI